MTLLYSWRGDNYACDTTGLTRDPLTCTCPKSSAAVANADRGYPMWAFTRWRRLHADEPPNPIAHRNSHAPARRCRRAEAVLRRRTHVRGGSRASVDRSRWNVPSQGVFAALRDPIVFNQVTVDHEAGAIVWPNGADLDPDVLYELAHGGGRGRRNRGRGEEKSRLKPRLG